MLQYIVGSSNYALYRVPSCLPATDLRHLSAPDPSPTRDSNSPRTEAVPRTDRTERPAYVPRRSSPFGLVDALLGVLLILLLGLLAREYLGEGQRGGLVHRDDSAPPEGSTEPASGRTVGGSVAPSTGLPRACSGLM